MFFSVAVNSFSAPRFSQKKCILLCSFNFHLAWGRTGLLTPLTCRCQSFSKYFTSLCICLDSAIGVFSSAVEGCLQALYMITRRISISNAKMLLTAMAMTAPVDKAALIADRREGSRARRRVTAAGRGGVRRLGSTRLWATGPSDTQDSIQRHGSSAGLFKEPAAPPQRQATAIRPAIWAIIYNRYDSASLQRHTAVVSEKGTCGLLTASGWVEAPTLRLLPIHTECKSISTVLLMKTPRQRPQQRLPRVCNPLLVFASLFFSGGAEV